MTKEDEDKKILTEKEDLEIVQWHFEYLRKN